MKAVAAVLYMKSVVSSYTKHDPQVNFPSLERNDTFDSKTNVSNAGFTVDFPRFNWSVYETVWQMKQCALQALSQIQ